MKIVSAVDSKADSLILDTAARILIKRTPNPMTFRSIVKTSTQKKKNEITSKCYFRVKSPVVKQLWR